MTKRPNVRIEAEGDVSLSMDEVGRDKVTVSVAHEMDEPSPGTGANRDRFRTFSIGNIVQWISSVPVIVKIVEAVKSLLI